MRKHLDSVRAPAELLQLRFHELAGSQEHVDTVAIGVKPLVQERFCRQNRRSGSSAVVAALRHDIPETVSVTALADFVVGNKVVVWAKQLEIVQVINDGNAMRF